MTVSDEPQKKTANIAQSNELTEAAYYLPLQAKRVLWLCLMQCYTRQGTDEGISPNFTLKVADYSSHFKVGIEQASKEVKKGLDMLLTSSVTFYLKAGDYEEVGYPWLAMAGVRSGRGRWDVEFNKYIMPYLVGLTSQFTTYNLYDVGKMSSVRAIRLYESLCQFRSSGIWVTTPEWLFTRFHLPESQRNNLAEMKRTFLTPSLKRINENTPLLAEMTQSEDGKLIFTIVEKS